MSDRKNIVVGHNLSAAGIARYTKDRRITETKEIGRKESESQAVGTAISSGGLFCSRLIGTGQGGGAGNGRCVTCGRRGGREQTRPDRD